MSLQIINPNAPLTEDTQRARKHARERLDREAERARIGWKGVQALAKEKFGKTSGLSLSKCNRLMQEIKKLPIVKEDKSKVPQKKHYEPFDEEIGEIDKLFDPTFPKASKSIP